MQPAFPECAFQRSHAHGSGPLPSRKSGGDPQQGMRVPVGRPKKRERNEAVCDPVKQQRIEKSGTFASERFGSQKAEAPSLIGKDGGICNVASVDRLVCIMTSEWNESMQRPVDRTTLAKVVATTADRDCLFRFLKLGGLSVLDRWLQEVNMGRSAAENETSAEGDRAVDDLLLALLGALERLPVDLVALKTCSIGNSVNYLCSHKHPHIQRRARKLVESWRRGVEPEIKEAGEVRPPMEQSSCVQQMDAGASALNTRPPSLPEHPGPMENSGSGRGKYASVASLCSSSDSQSKTSSTNIPTACSADTSTKSPIGTVKSSNEGAKLALESAHLSHVRPQSSEDGRAASSACVPGAYNNQLRVARNTGRNKHGKAANLSTSNTSSVATALSGAVFVSTKYNTEQGLVIDRSAHGACLSSPADVCNLSCCSFFRKGSDNAVVYDRPSRSTLNSASSCVADCAERAIHPIKHNQNQMCSEPAQTGIQLLASTVASESSTIDLKSPDSPSVKSVGLQRVTTLPIESKIHAEGTLKLHNHQPLKAGGSPLDREHYDRNSSTVSSPSETSAHIDSHMSENKRASAVYECIPSPADTTSESSLPSGFVREDADTARGISACNPHKENGNVQSSCELSRMPCLPSTCVAEAVGESSIMDKVDCINRFTVMKCTVFENSTAKKASTERSVPLRCSKDSLEVTKKITLEGDKVGVSCKGTLSKRASFDTNFAPCGGTTDTGKATVAFASAGSKQNSTTALPLCNASFTTVSDKTRNSSLGAHSSTTFATADAMEQKQSAQLDEAAASALMEETERPLFDLNEMFRGSEEGLVQSSGPMSNVGRSIQGFSVPASDAMPSLPILPMTPIAVVAAAKGPFSLPAISCCCLPTGEPGWKGSAATSAFRPTQPRRSLEKSICNNVPEQRAHGKTILDFDLNLAVDSSSPVYEKVGNADASVKLSSVDVEMASNKSASEAIVSSILSRKDCEPVRASWDLNRFDEGAMESETKLDFDLNDGPVVQDNDDIVLAAKHIRMKEPLPALNMGTSSRLPSQPQTPVTPILMPAYAMPNSDTPYPAGSAVPWINGGPHDGLLQYNIFMQNPSAFASSGMACPALSPMAAGPYQAIPFGFSSTTMQGFSVPLGETHAAPQLAAAIPPLATKGPFMASQSKPPYIVGVLADAVHQQGMGGLWNRPKLDLNAGPEAIDSSYIRDERRHMLVTSEQMRARPQVIDMAAALQQREQEGRVCMPGSMQGMPLKQSVWR